MRLSTTPRSTLIVPHSTDPVAELLERDRVIGAITELFVATDRKDWPAVERCFASRVRLDMSSAGGAPAGDAVPADIAAGWRSALAPIEQLHHQSGNFRVRITGVRAEAWCHGIAYHFRKRRDGRDSRVFVGTYDFELEKESPGWRITAMRFNLKFVDGNATLEAPE